MSEKQNVNVIKEKLCSLLHPEQNLCIGSLNRGPVHMLNAYPAGKFLFFDDKNFVYYDREQYGGKGPKIKDSWDVYFHSPYLYCSWHLCGKHSFQLVNRGRKLADFDSFDQALAALFIHKNDAETT